MSEAIEREHGRAGPFLPGLTETVLLLPAFVLLAGGLIC
jgi:hypothetical protein